MAFQVNTEKQKHDLKAMVLGFFFFSGEDRAGPVGVAGQVAKESLLV